MANARPPSGGTPTARLGIDLSSFQRAPQIAREAGKAAAREISNAFKQVQAEQRLAQTQAQQTLAVLRAQQSQITATTRAESQVRIQQIRAESVIQQQAARAATQVTIQEERRKTAAFNAEIRTRQQTARLGGDTGAVIGGARNLAGAFGIGLGIAGVVQAGRQVVESTQLATAYGRQELAALSLAGSQAKLNQLMAAYEKATGGAIDKAASLSNITRLQATGFADNAQELDRFVRAVRGSSIAMGKTQDEIGQEVQLAISNQSVKRLDQIGLGVEETNNRITELRANNSGMTREMAFQEAVLGLLGEKYGALAASVKGQASGVELLTTAWTNLRLEMGKAEQGPVNTIAGRLAARVDATAEVFAIERQRQAANRVGTIPGGLSEATDVAGAQTVLNNLRQGLARVMQDIETGARPASQTGPLLIELNEKIRAASISVAGLSAQRLLATGDLPQGAPDIRGGPAAVATPRFTDEQTAIIVEREAILQQITRSSAREIVEVTRDGARQRASVIAQYGKQTVREAEDFGRQRANAERKHAFALLDVAQDSARQRVKWEQELARNIAQAQADSAERVAELREDSSKRLVESEEKYAKDREKRQNDFAKRIRDAAANLDAVEVRELQRARREEAKEAKDAHEEQKQEIGAQLQERLDDEAKSLAKSERQAREANQRRVEEQAENDRLRIEEMKAAFEAQKIEEDIERAISLERRAADHQAQLREMALAQAERITQIREAEAEALAEANKAYDLRLQAQGVHNAKLEAEQRRHQVNALRSYQAHIDALDAIVKGQIQGPQPLNTMITPGQFPSLLPGSASTRTSSVVIQSGAIVIQTLPGQDNAAIGAYVLDVVADFFEDYHN